VPKKLVDGYELRSGKAEGINMITRWRAVLLIKCEHRSGPFPGCHEYFVHFCCLIEDFFFFEIQEYFLCKSSPKAVFRQCHQHVRLDRREAQVALWRWQLLAPLFFCFVLTQNLKRLGALGNWRPCTGTRSSSLLTNSTEQRLSWEANSHSASQEIPCLIWNL
jgi:hypothetical protein